MLSGGVASPTDRIDSVQFSREEIQEVLLQTTVYCGVPAALESFRIAAEVLKEEDAKKR